MDKLFNKKKIILVIGGGIAASYGLKQLEAQDRS